MHPMIDTTATDDRSRVLTEALGHAATILEINQPELAQVLGLDPASVARLFAGDYRLAPDSREWERACLLLRLCIGLDAMLAGDVIALRAWMRQPNADLGAVPAALITQAGGLTRTVEYVEACLAR